MKKIHLIILIFTYLLTGCFAALVEKQNSSSNSDDSAVEMSYPAPSAITRLSPLSIRENVVNLRISGVANGDEVSIYTDAHCTQQIAVGTLQTNSSSISLTTSQLTDQTYSLYAKRQNAEVQSICSQKLYDLVIDTDLNTPIQASLNATNSTATNKVLDLSHLVNGDVLKFYSDSNCTELIGSKTLLSSNTPSSTFSINSDTYRKYGTYTVYGTKSYTKNSITTIGNCLSTQVNLTFALAAPTTATFTTTPKIHDQTIQISVGAALAGDLIEVYTDAQCSQKVGQGTIATAQTSVSITTDQLSSGLNQIFAKRSSTLNSVTSSSICSISSLINHTYVPMAAPVINSKTVLSSTQINLSLSNLTAGDTILIFPAHDCTYATVAPVASFTASAVTESVTIDSDITRTYGNVTFTTQSTFEGLTSSCTQSNTSHQFNLSAPTEFTLTNGTTNYEKLIPVNIKYGLPGDTMKVYTNNTCTDLIGEGVVGSDLIASFQTTTAFNVGTIHLYAKRFFGSTESACSNELYQYNYQNLPASTFASLIKTTGISFNLSFSDFKNAHEIYLYSDSSCTTELDHKTVSGTAALHFVVNLANGNYPLYYKSKYNQFGGTSIYSQCTDANIVFNQNGFLSTSFVYKFNLNNLTLSSSTLSLKFKGSSNVYIHWGDKSVNIIQGTYDGYSNLPSHTYSTKQIYEIEISGQFDGIEINEGQYSSNTLVDVLNWGTNQFKSTERMFLAQTGITTLSATDIPDFSLNTNMSYMFAYCSHFNGSLNNWDVSHITDMNHLFYYADAFNQPLNNWNVSNVTNMGSMFERASYFNQNISSWNVANVTNFNNMFTYTQFNQAIGVWNTSSATDMSSMFSYNYSFNQNINSWNVANITNMSGMFASAYGFNQPLNSWNVSNVTNMANMFDYADIFNQPLNNWNTSKVIYMQYMFYRARSFNNDITTWNTSNVMYMDGMFSYTQNFNQAIGNWDTSNVVSMYTMFSSALMFNQPLNNWNTAKVTNMGHMFSNTQNFNQPLNNWDTTSVTNMNYIFSYALNFNQNINSWNTSNLNEMRGIFSNAQSFNQPLNNWNTSKAIYMDSLFRNASSFNQPLNNWDTSRAIYMWNMFDGATNFNQNLNSWDVNGHVLYCTRFATNSALQLSNFPSLSCNYN